MNTPHLSSLIEQHLAGRAADFGLSGDAIRADYILNWGGFVNHSFTITDGDTRYHLKLSGDAGDRRTRRTRSRRRQRAIEAEIGLETVAALLGHEKLAGHDPHLHPARPERPSGSGRDAGGG